MLWAFIEERTNIFKSSKERIDLAIVT